MADEVEEVLNNTNNDIGTYFSTSGVSINCDTWISNDMQGDGSVT